MPNPRLAAALSRIDAAVLRLEAVALAVPPAADERLAERHRALQASAAAAITRIDRLVGVEP